MNLKTYELLNSMIENEWSTEGLKDGDDILQIVTGGKILMAYVYKGCIEVSVGENTGGVEHPDIFPTEVWGLEPRDFKGLGVDGTVEKFKEVFQMVKVECLNCSHEQELKEEESFHDELGKYTFCENCGSSYDVE